MDLHGLHHLRRNVSLWRMNNSLAKTVMRHDLEKDYDGYRLCKASVQQLKEIETLHVSLFREPMLGWLVWVYRFQASKFISVALDRDGKVAGYECFMFNEVEIDDRILHEVYIGVREDAGGKGLATALRRYSLECFDFGTLNGISSVASLSDIKALRSAQKAGFAITRQSLKPPGHYLFKPLTLRR